ncbi:hypothetical protein U8V72_24730 [Priestia filamentosa]
MAWNRLIYLIKEKQGERVLNEEAYGLLELLKKGSSNQSTWCNNYC